MSVRGGGTPVSKPLILSSGTHMFSGSSKHRDLIFSAALPLNSQIFALSATSKDNFSDINARIVFYSREFQRNIS